MLEKLKELLSSLRFWAITFAWLAAYLGVVQQNGFNPVELLNQIAYWLGTVAGVGTIDKAFKSIK
jgi:hypothetical protein